MNTLNIENPEIGEAIEKAWGTPSELSVRERRIVASWLFLRFRHGDMAYFQYERGAIDESRLRSTLEPLIQTLDNQYARDFWKRVQGNFVPSYRAHLNQQLANVDDAQSN